MTASCRLSICCAAAALFAGCATAPLPLTSASPASPDAPEGARTPRQSSLRADDLTRQTAALLSAASEDNSSPEMKHAH